MDDSINSWVDPEEVKRIAESLMGEVKQEGDWEAEHASSGAKKDDAPANPVRLSAEKSLAEASKLASSSGMLSQAKPQAKPAKAQSADDKHLQQVQAEGVLGKLEKWLCEETGAVGVCVVDRDGDVLHSSMENVSWVGLTVASASMAENPDGGAIRLRVSGAYSLQLIPANTSRGGVLIGILLREPVAQEEALKLAKKSTEIADS